MLFSGEPALQTVIAVKRTDLRWHNIYMKCHTELTFRWSWSARTSCCCRSSWSSGPWWRWAAAALAGWRPLGSSRRDSLQLYCALPRQRQGNRSEEEMWDNTAAASPHSPSRYERIIIWKDDDDKEMMEMRSCISLTDEETASLSSLL